MATYQDREHFIPLRRNELVKLLCDQLPENDAAEFRTFCARLSDRVHLEFYRLLERLKEDYSLFDPDSDTKSLRATEGTDRAQRSERFFADVDKLLTRANFLKVPREQVMACQKGSSAWGIAMSIDLDAFAHFNLYVRGKVHGKRALRSWRTWFKTRILDVEVYQRLVVVLQQKKHPRLGRDPDTRSVFLKLFKDIPTADLEMLIPGARLQMPKFERGKIGFSIISGLVVISYQLLAPIFLAAKAAVGGLLAYGPWGILAALFGYGYRQYYGYQFSLKSYNLKLAQSLYYQNLDNNGGVLFRLLDSAEEQDCREAILAYFYLLKSAGEQGMTAEQLDDTIEAELEETVSVTIDFEVVDALAKVEKIGLVRRDGDRYFPISVSESLSKLDSLPNTAVFTREMTHDDRPLDLAPNAGDRDVRSAEDLRTRPEPQSTS